jgi:hypothetical protein
MSEEQSIMPGAPEVAEYRAALIAAGIPNGPPINWPANDAPASPWPSNLADTQGDAKRGVYDTGATGADILAIMRDMQRETTLIQSRFVLGIVPPGR